MKAYKIISLVAVALSLASCEDFLDKQPDENLTLDDVFANRLYTRDFLTHTYSWLPTEANMADDGGAWRNPLRPVVMKWSAHSAVLMLTR